MPLPPPRMKTLSLPAKKYTDFFTPPPRTFPLLLIPPFFFLRERSFCRRSWESVVLFNFGWSWRKRGFDSFSGIFPELAIFFDAPPPPFSGPTEPAPAPIIFFPPFFLIRFRSGTASAQAEQRNGGRTWGGLRGLGSYNGFFFVFQSYGKRSTPPRKTGTLPVLRAKFYPFFLGGFCLLWLS